MAAATLTVLLFARPREIVGASSARLSVPARCTVRDVKEALGQAYPPLRALLPSCMIAVNEEYAEDDIVVCENDEIALIVPVSGG